MNDEKEKTIEKLSNERVAEVSGGKAPKEEAVYNGRKPRFTHPITFKKVNK